MDLLELLAETDRLDYTGPAPLHFTGDYFTPDELMAAHDEAARLDDTYRNRHTWHESITLGWCGVGRGHALCILSTDLRCHCGWGMLVAEREQMPPCWCVGDLYYQANCPDCRWHVIGSERDVVLAWHDHAWPGWRDLPVVPYAVAERTGGMNPKTAIDGKRAKKARAWVEANYPARWQAEGAPVITERRGQYGHRSVPGYSPWGGFDISSRSITGESA